MSALRSNDFEPRPMRCERCFYVLENLTSNRCPECGLSFDPRDPFTYTRKLPFVRWRFWLPAAVLALGGGIVLYPLLILWVGYGWATTIVLPFSISAVFGYATRVGKVATAIMGLVVIVALLIGIASMSLTGIFCILVLGAVAFAPVIVGGVTGVLLREALKKSKWNQRDYLPVLFLFLLPLIWALLEGRPRGLPVVSVLTSQIVEASPADTWDGIQFYEDVKHQPPWLLRLPIWRPVYTTGSSQHVGDTKVCVYTKGKLVKRITKVEVGKRLDFDVVVQDKIETEAVRLIGGSFVLEPVDGGKRTRVTLETRYEPLLTPRLAWQPFETYAVSTLHGHVLRGMKEEAEHPDPKLRKLKALQTGENGQD